MNCKHNYSNDTLQQISHNAKVVNCIVIFVIIIIYKYVYRLKSIHCIILEYASKQNHAAFMLTSFSHFGQL